MTKASAAFVAIIGILASTGCASVTPVQQLSIMHHGRHWCATYFGDSEPRDREVPRIDVYMAPGNKCPEIVVE